MSKLPSSWPRSARKGGPKRPTANTQRTELGALKPYVFRHFMRDPRCRCSPARFFEKGALSLQSCAFWRTQPASFPPWTTYFYDFFGFCSWRLQPGSSWARFYWVWLILAEFWLVLVGICLDSGWNLSGFHILERSGNVWEGLGRSRKL